MTKGHYHHHLEEATGEPTVIEIGEAYPEELDPELHEFNRLAKKVADAAVAYILKPNPNPPPIWESVEAYRNLRAAAKEYEKMVSVAELGEE